MGSTEMEWGAKVHRELITELGALGLRLTNTCVPDTHVKKQQPTQAPPPQQGLAFRVCFQSVPRRWVAEIVALDVIGQAGAPARLVAETRAADRAVEVGRSPAPLRAKRWKYNALRSRKTANPGRNMVPKVSCDGRPVRIVTKRELVASAVPAFGDVRQLGAACDVDMFFGPVSPAVH